ncbi:phospholipid-transporting ATPase IF-like [Macrobrachium nipponense]|uniref:phospholipid-transporting ATPase IF-like n=1 Tax=Macrobrachium nipponense TaxID=159736 RepID=UPI0030C8666A
MGYEIRCAQSGERAKANTSDLNEEFGTEEVRQRRDQIKVLDEYSVVSEPLPTFPKDLDVFLETLALCHTVRVTVDASRVEDGLVHQSSEGAAKPLAKFQYQAASPDEKALVEACASFGVIFEKQQGNQLTLDVRGEKRTFTRLQVLEFDSDRKRMSVAVKENSTGRIWLPDEGRREQRLPEVRPPERPSA